MRHDPGDEGARAVTVRPARIARRKPGTPERAFDRLREEGLHWLQRLGGEVWSDHNLHDPGITLLEQLCFALMDLEYRADYPVADHLTGADGRIDYAGLSLHPPTEVFPCRATTAEDVRRVLLDAVAGLDDATLEDVAPADAQGRGGIAGVHRLTLKPAPGRAADLAERLAAARAAYRRERNLCEDLDDGVTLVRDVPVELVGEIEIDGPRDAVEVLAEVYDRCARFVARVPRRVSLEQALHDGHSLEQILTGPRVRHGVIVASEHGAGAGDELFLADLAALARDIDGVVHARLEALRTPADGGLETVSVAWRGIGWALRMRVPDEAGDTPTGLVVKRRGNAVAIDARALRVRHADLQAGDLARRARVAVDPSRVVAARLPRGSHRPGNGYRSVQHDFPPAYGLGQHGLPSSAPAEERARVRQYKAYLRLFDQVIADGMAQVEQLAALFSIDGESTRSYWTQDVEGGPADDLLLDSAAVVLRAVHAPFDHKADRKSRALDHLLALHGVVYRQDSMRQFGGHLDADEQDAWLLQNKAAYLRDVVALGRDRAGGYDYAASSWDDSDNCSGLQRRASLLMGFRLSHDRPLTRPLLRQRLGLRAATAAGDDTPVAGRPAGTHRFVRVAPAATPAQQQEDLRRIRPLHAGSLPGALLRAGVRREHYAVALSEPAGDHRRGRACKLVLGPDEDGRWWTLGEFEDTAQAARAADTTRWFLRQLNDASEGLHVVEHVLLRPVSAGSVAADPVFHALRLTVLLPAWSTRTHAAAFRHFAEETLHINCPAHLALACRWLEFDAMQRFEDDFEQWMQARAAHVRALDAGDATLPERAAAVDAASARIVAHLAAAERAAPTLAEPGHE